MNTKERLEMMKEIEKRNDQRIDEHEDRIRVLFVDVYGDGDVKELWIRRELEDYYRVLGCHTIDMPMRSIGGRNFQIICDDEGLFVSNFRVSAVGRSMQDPQLVGNLIICQWHGGEEVDGLTDEEIQFIRLRIKGIAAAHPGGFIEKWHVIKDMDWAV